jgi:hypothetical protein
MIEKARREASFAQLRVDAERLGVEKERHAERAVAVDQFMADYEEYMSWADLESCAARTSMWSVPPRTP